MKEFILSLYKFVPAKSLAQFHLSKSVFKLTNYYKEYFYGRYKKKKTQKDPGETVIQNIIENYRHLEQSIVSQLKICNDLHPTTTGSAREDVWLQLFEMIVPKKFVIEHSIFIIDSFRHVSREVDLAIIDNNYTPYIFRYGRLKYVTIEAVAAVIECKSTRVTFQKDMESEKKVSGMTDWCNCIKQLRTSRESIARMATGTVVKGKNYNATSSGPYVTSTQTATRPIRIFCGYKTELPDQSKNLKEIRNFFDFALLAKDDDNKNKIEIITSAHLDESKTLKDWYMELDHHKYEEEKAEVDWGEEKALEIIENEALKDFNLNQFKISQEEEDIPLLSFNFQLNQLLMLINNPMLFPHLGYVKMFNGDSTENKTC